MTRRLGPRMRQRPGPHTMRCCLAVAAVMGLLLTAGPPAEAIRWPGPITVLDEIVFAIPRGKVGSWHHQRRWWRARRDEFLASVTEGTGGQTTFVVKERPPTAPCQLETTIVSDLAATPEGHTLLCQNGGLEGRGLSMKVVDSNGVIRRAVAQVTDWRNLYMLCHEMGHTLGLAHRAESTSCMQTPGTASRLDAYDYHLLVGGGRN